MQTIGSRCMLQNDKNRLMKNVVWQVDTIIHPFFLSW